MRSSGWRDGSIPHPPCYRDVSPPQPVTIDLDQALARDNPPLRSVRPLWVTAAGLKLTGSAAGELHAWIRLDTGTWLGLCVFVAHSGNQRAQLQLRQWVPRFRGRGVRR